MLWLNIKIFSALGIIINIGLAAIIFVKFNAAANYILIYVFTQTLISLKSTKHAVLLLVLYFMKRLVFLSWLFLQPAAIACEIKPENIKASVRSALDPLHQQFNILISREDFESAYAKLTEINKDIGACFKHYQQYEFDNYHFKRWGEVSSKYSNTSRQLDYLLVQVKHGSLSYDLGWRRPLLFNAGMWEEVANDFYAKKIW